MNKSPGIWISFQKLKMFKDQLPQEDFALIFKEARESLLELKNTNIFITGATGFFGKWLTQTFTVANKELQLNLNLYLLSRDWLSFNKKHPDFFDSSFTHFLTGSTENFTPPSKCDVVIHLANEARPAPEKSLQFSQSMRQSNQHMLEVLQKIKPKKFLLTSSGAVYGPSYDSVTEFNEDSPLLPETTYGKEKLAQELFFSENLPPETQLLIARCFTFIGPFLPLNGAYAAGNFLLNGLNNAPITIKGTGRPMRSYLYMADLMVWLLKILDKGTPYHPYNVGSEETISIENLAQKIAQLSASPQVQIEGKINQKRESLSYLPSTKRANTELNLRSWTPLEEAIKKTLNWYKDCVI